MLNHNWLRGPSEEMTAPFRTHLDRRSPGDYYAPRVERAFELKFSAYLQSPTDHEPSGNVRHAAGLADDGVALYHQEQASG